MTKRVLFLLVFLLSLGCEGNDTPDAPTDQTETRPEHAILEVTLEGQPELMDAALFRSPPDFPLEFSTYVPIDMQAEMVPEGGRDAVRIIAAFGGHRDRDAEIRIVPFPDDTDAPAARTATDGIAADLGGVARPDSRYVWTEVEYTLQNVLVGSLLLAEHRGQWWYMITRYPPEYGDGMAARSGVIIDEWYWADTGAPLHDGD